MGQSCVKCNRDRVLIVVGKLVAVQISGAVGLDVRENEPLKALHNDWCRGNWATVTETPDCLLFGHGDHRGRFKACGDYSLLQGQLKDVSEHPC